MKKLLKFAAVGLLVVAAAMIVVYRAVNQVPSADLPENRHPPVQGNDRRYHSDLGSGKNEGDRYPSRYRRFEEERFEHVQC